MSRILTIATSEFLSLVRTKFFIIGILMMPVLVGASIGFQVFAARRIDRDDRVFGVIDRSGTLADTLAREADARNAQVAGGPERTGARFVPQRLDPAGGSAEDLRVDASDRVRRKEWFAFVEIPAAALDPDSTEPIAYYTDTPSYNTLPDWLERTLGREITERRLQAAGIDAALVTRLSETADFSTLELVDRNPDGTVAPARRVDQLVTFVLPFGLMYLLFLSVMTSAPQLLNAVIEEKMSKISEVLVASVTPFQLMMGKLIGSAGLATVLALVYLIGGVYALLTTGRLELLNPALIGWFLLFLLCTVLMYGAIFISIGAASADIKDAQGMMQPAMILVILPMIASPVVLRAPDSGIAMAASLFPTSAPFIMLVRLAMRPGPPLWEVLLSVALMLGTTMLFVWAAGRIFRVGLLMQGKSATLKEMLRWIRA